MNRKILFAILILSIILFIAGCFGGECKIDSDCPDPGKCFTAKCVDKMCTTDKVPNCCGNGMCEAPGEDKGNCPQDCGACEGAVKGSTYLVNSYDKVSKKCATDIKKEVQIEQTSTGKIATGAKVNLNVVSLFDNPFNIDKDLFIVQISPDTIPPTVSNFKITKIELSGQNANKQTIILGSLSAERTIFDAAAVINYEMKLKPIAKIVDESFTRLALKVYYSYNIERSGSIQSKTESKDVQLSQITLTLVDPTITPVCPETCDDGNSATKDSCSKATDYFCIHTPIPGKCGNFKCDGSETKCSCPVDCGKCEGDAGVYLVYTCSEDNNCGAQIRSDVTLSPTTILDEKTIAGSTVVGRYTYDEPFDKSRSVFSLEFELTLLAGDVSNFKIEEVRVLESATLLGNVKTTALLSQQGATTTIDVPLDFSMAEHEASKTITLDISYSYEKNSDHKTGKITKSLGNLAIINPTIQ